MLWKGFQKPKRLAAELESLTDKYGRFSAPFRGSWAGCMPKASGLCPKCGFNTRLPDARKLRKLRDKGI